MTGIDRQLTRCLLSVGFIFTLMGNCLAAPLVDASNDVGGSSAALSLRPSNFWAQTFTVSTDGLLSQIDVQVGKFPGATGDVRFEIRPLVDGIPTDDYNRSLLFKSSISIDDIPVINSLSDPPAFVSVDVSDAGIHAKPGDQFAITMLRSGGSPVVAWRSTPNTYSGGHGFFRSLLNAPWSNTVEDLGFQTWIDPTPSDPYKLRVDATFDVSYRPGEISSLTEGEATLLVGGIPGHDTFPEQRPVMEFPLMDLPANAIIQGAYLEIQHSASSGSPQIGITGFAGDGIASFTDATARGAPLALTEPMNASSSRQIPIDSNYVASLIGQASHLGVRMQSIDLPQYISFYSTESNFSSLLPPRLVIEYTLPDLEGDFNHDHVIDSEDLAQWQSDFGLNDRSDADNDGDSDGADFLAWQRNFSGTSAIATTVPEPSSLFLLTIGLSFFSKRQKQIR